MHRELESMYPAASAWHRLCSNLSQLHPRATCCAASGEGYGSHDAITAYPAARHDGRLGPALPACQFIPAPPRSFWGAATTKAGAAPHLYTHRGDAVTDPIRWPPRDISRRDRSDVARVWLTAPRRPIRSHLERDRTTWPGVPSFFYACEVSCRVRAERAMHYALL